MKVRHNFRNMLIWKHGLEIADRVYDFVETLPGAEKYNLVSQCIRSGCSIPANIAEGSGKGSDKEFSRFLGISLASAYELETHLLICARRNFGNKNLLEQLLQHLKEEQQMIMSFQDRLDGK